MIRRKAALLAPVLALLIGSSAAAQVGVLDQPFRNDPFQPLLRGGWSVTPYISAGVDNNTLGVADMVALGYLADDFRISDIFLVAGLIPQGEGVRLGTQNRVGLTVTFPMGRYLTLGVIGGVRAIGTGRVPDDLTALVRDGFTGDEITVDLTELGAQAFGYAEGGLSGVMDMPLLPTLFGDLTLIAGAGARYVHSLAHIRTGFAGDTGEDTSTFTLSRTGVTTALSLATPIGDEVLSEAGSGVAVDLMAGLALGHMAQLRLAVTDLGSANVTVGAREVRTITMDGISVLDVGGEADSASVTDTLAAEIRSVPLPTTFRADASYRPLDMVGFGARLAVPLGDEAPALEPLLQAGVEFRPFPALPLRAGVLGGGDFGTGFFAGLGLDARGLGLELEVASSGGPAPVDMRGVSIRSMFSLRF